MGLTKPVHNWKYPEGYLPTTMPTTQLKLPLEDGHWAYNHYGHLGKKNYSNWISGYCWGQLKNILIMFLNNYSPWFQEYVLQQWRVKEMSNCNKDEPNCYSFILIAKTMLQSLSGRENSFIWLYAKNSCL